jgi:hypothetical protein
LIDGATNSVSQIGDAIFVLDLTIDQWNLQLARAQPLLPNRILVNYVKRDRVKVKGKALYDSGPVVGKMVEMKSGSWRFVSLTRRDIYTKLSDLRVGKSLRSDAMVVRLIDGIEDMLAQRQSLVEILNAMRSGLPGKLSAIIASCNRRSDQAIDMSARVKLDWNADAAGSRLAIQKANSEKYQAKKARALKAKADLLTQA